MAYIYVIKLAAQKVFNGCSNQSTSKTSASIFCHSRHPLDDACAAGFTLLALRVAVTSLSSLWNVQNQADENQKSVPRGGTKDVLNARELRLGLGLAG